MNTPPSRFEAELNRHRNAEEEARALGRSREREEQRQAQESGEAIGEFLRTMLAFGNPGLVDLYRDRRPVLKGWVIHGYTSSSPLGSTSNSLAMDRGGKCYPVVHNFYAKGDRPEVAQVCHSLGTETDLLPSPDSLAQTVARETF